MKKKLSLILSIIMISSLVLMGCNKEGLALFKAFEKTQKIKSYGYEGQASISMDVLDKDVEGSVIPKEASMFFPIDLKFNFDGKSIMDYEKAIKQEVNLEYDFMDIKTNSKILTEIDMTKDASKFKVFMELPRAMKNLMGLGKSDAKYIYYTSDSLQNFIEKQGLNEVSEMMAADIDAKTMKEFQEISMNLLNKLKDSFKENANLVKSTGKKTFKINDKNKSLDMYEITLNRDNMSNILCEIVNNEAFVKECLEIATKVSPKEMQGMSVDEMMKEYKANKEFIVSSLKEALKSLDKNSVIKSTFGLSDGYVVYQNLLFDIYAAGNANVKFNYEIKVHDINKNIKINMPKENSKECVELYSHIGKITEIFKAKAEENMEEEIFEEVETNSIDVSKYMAREVGKKYTYRNSSNNSIKEVTTEIVKDNLIQERIKDSIGNYSVLYRANKDKVDIISSHYYGSEKMVDLTKNKIDEKSITTMLFDPAAISDLEDESGKWCYMESEKKTIETPVGKFQAITLNVNNEDGSYEENFYAEGIGMVKSVIHTAEGDVTVVVLEKIKK